MPQAAGQLVGRGPELARLDRALNELGRAPARVLHVVGEPGIGKSRLIAECVSRARVRNHLVFAGRAAEFEDDFPFGAFVDALDPYLTSLNPARFRALGEEEREELAGVFPGLAEFGGQREAGLQHERYRSHRAVRMLLELLAREQPTVLVLDDMHWADEASLELLSHLLRRRLETRVLLVLAFRPAQAPRRLAAALELAEREGAAERMELAPLIEAEIDEFLGSRFTEPAKRELRRESGGNPFYLEQLARTAGRELRASELPLPRGLEVPRAVGESIADELGRLSDETRVVLQAGAVAGDPFEPALAARIAGLPEENVLSALDQLLELGLIRPTETPLYFRFRHPIVRRAVYESTQRGWRLGAHARAASALAVRGAQPAVYAYHVEQSASPGDDDAVALLAEAGHATASRAPAIAARWLQAALRLLPSADGDGQRRLELLVPLARALGSSGQLEASRETLGEVLELLPPEAGPVRAQVIAFMSLIEHLLGRHGEARALIVAALHGLPDDRSPEGAALQAELAADCFFLGEWEEMRERAERATALAREVGEPGVHTTAAALLGLAFYELARVEEAREAVAEAMEIIDGLSDDELALRIDACHWLGWCEHLIDHYDDSIRHMRRGIAISRKTGQGHVLAPMTIGLVIAHTWQGRLLDAATHADEAIEVAHLAGSDQLLAWALTMKCWVEGRRGAIDEAIKAGEEAVRVSDRVARGPYSVVASCWLSEARLEAGDPERARKQLLAAVDGPGLPGVEHAFRSCIHELLTRIELALGRVDEAAEWARRAEASVDGLGLPGREAFALRAVAAVALARDDPRRAVGLALGSAEAAGNGYRIEAARSRLLAGSALSAGGDRERAVHQLELARLELDACGALRDRDRAVRALRRLGEHVARPGRRGRGASGPKALSARELEVALLVKERLTNREIAERLVISEKTVERHLSRIFVKLGVGSRAEVARAIEAAEPPAESL